MSEVAILVPVYLNAPTIAALARRVMLAMGNERYTYKLVFVVDASPDDSWHVVKQLARADSRVCGILLDRNQGQHRALIAGLREVQTRWVVVMDADLQDPPELLPLLIDECDRTGLTVFACRKGMYQNPARMLSSRLFKSLLGALVDMPSNVGTYFAIPEQVAERIRSAPVTHVQMVVMARIFSSDFSTINFARCKRSEGESAYSSFARLRSAFTSLACAWECRGLGQGARFSSYVEMLAPIGARVNI